MGCQEELLVEKVCEIYEKLSRLENLNPSEDVNTLFTTLVLTCTPQCSIDVTKLSKRVQDTRSNLMRLSGEAEGLLESHFSTLIGSYDNPLQRISVLPYYSNYIKLSHLEFTMLYASYEKVPTQVAFVGSGPLPLTSIVLATYYLSTTIFHNYDVDPLANGKAVRLVQSDPDLSRRMLFHTTDIINVSNELKDYEVVFLAALVGIHKEDKARVFDHLAKHMAPEAFLMLRSAHGARGFLYPLIDPSHLQGFEVMSVFHPTDEVINSVIAARKPLSPIHLPNQGLHSTTFPNKYNEIQGFNIVNHANMILTIDEELS